MISFLLLITQNLNKMKKNIESTNAETTDKKLIISDVMSSDDITSYSGKLLVDMNKDELIVIVKHLCGVLKKIQKMDENIDKKVKTTMNILKIENNLLRRFRNWW